jgi:hypothetical protein
MKDNIDPLLARMNRLLVAHHAAPEDRARVHLTIKLVSRALLAVSQARNVAERARRRRERADANLADRQSELAAPLVELQIMIEDIRR